VRSNPTPAKAAPDATAMLRWLQGAGAPGGSATVLDMEEATTRAYVAAYGERLHAGGFAVLVYESIDASNPTLDGRFVADPGATVLFPGSVATQYAYEGAYDLSWVTPAVPLWEVNPPRPEPAAGPVPFRGVVEIVRGVGWFPLPPAQSGARVVSVDVDEPDPADVGRYVPVPAYAGASGALAPDGATTGHRTLVFGPGPFGPAADGRYSFTYWLETSS
jgi:hypothetical protein